MKENENVALTEKLKQTKMKLKAAREEIDELKKNVAGNSDSYGRDRIKQNFEKKLTAMKLQRDHDSEV
jgi:hypothetical protein